MSDPLEEFTGHCIRHGAVHLMGVECWDSALDWNSAHQDMPMPEREAAYKAEVRRRMAEKPGSCVYPVGCVYPGEGCTGPCADRDNPDMRLMARMYAEPETEGEQR